ncbi:MAG: tyrosine-type recombinase/integrase [Actinomycetales bacterium]|nr:tyrosine-type recombinase/integrase [Actinomycetales bacterium]
MAAKPEQPGLPDLTEIGAQDLVEAWTTRITSASEGLATATSAAYISGLRRFIMYATTPNDRDFRHLRRTMVTPKTMRTLVDELAAEYAPSTVGVTMSAARSFCELLVEEGELDSLPEWPRARPVTGDEFDPPHYDRDEVAALLAAAADTNHNIATRVRDQARDVAILQVLFTLGLRASELVEATVAWIRGAGEDTTFRVVGKGDKARVLPIGASPELLLVLDSWTTHRRHTIGPTTADSPLFCKQNGTALTYDGLLYLFNAWLTISDRRHAQDPSDNAAVRRFQDRAKIHACRHTAAFNMIGVGTPLNLVQGVLGHANIATTSLYVKASGAELKTAIQAIAVPTPTTPPAELGT